ncbi:TIGR02556 family CRISPR-associated protein [Methanosphaera cuniculi]|uniref:TIGR02556 family CRISPR-associated protein n=1 Tax=Methanosphaera cuniculi TaxID=1077256 RepID=UPI0026DBBEB1|nr:TIGR02556 family CRISPR-associated protein [Methanosphaera cuniculi]
MLASMYELGKLWVQKENMETINIVLDSDKLKNTNKVLFVDMNIDENGEINYDCVTLEDYSKKKNLNYLYKKGSSRGTNLSPSSLITEPNTTFDIKFIKWFKDNAKNDELINKSLEAIDENKDDILSEITHIYDELSSDDKRNVLLTIRFNTNDKTYYLNDYDIFKNLLLEKATEKSYKSGSKKSIGESTCYLCNEYKEVYGLVPGYVGLTFGTADKPGNTPNFNITEQWKQSGICKDCILYLEAGKKFVEKYLNFSEFGLRYYVIPTFFFNKKEVFDELYEDILEIENKRKYSDMVEKEDEFAEIVEELNDVLEFKFLYYEINNSSFKIIGYIESVIPSWLQQIYQTQQKVKSLPLFNENNMKIIFGEKNSGDFISRIKNNNKNYPLNEYNWYLGLLRDFISFNENKYYMELVNSIMTSNKIDYDFILKKIMDKIRSNWRNEEFEFMKINIFKSLHLMIFLNDLKLFRGEKTMKIGEATSPENILDTLDDPAKKACFLLGVLTRKLTLIQFKQLGSTPFVKKLWGLNLDYDKIKQLYVKVIDKLTEYNSFHYYGDIEEEITLNLAIADEKWNLNKNETSYYFVLGYTVGKDFKLNKEGENNE